MLADAAMMLPTFKAGESGKENRRHLIFNGCALLVTALVLLSDTRAAHAEPITFRITGMVSNSSGPAENLFGTPVPVGSTVSFTLTLDSVPPNDQCSNCDTYRGVPYGVRFDIGNGLAINGLTSAAWFPIIPPSFGGGYQASAESLFTLGYTRIAAATVFFGLPDGSAPPASFPTDPAILQATTIRHFSFGATMDIDADEGVVTPFDVAFGGSITSVTAEAFAPVPEPGTFALLSLAGSVVGLSRLRRKRHHDLQIR